MKKLRGKKIISVMLMLSMLFGVCMIATAAAAPAATKSSLRSQGIICYQEGTESVVIDSADLYTLADRLDLFKVRTVEQLGVIGTYLSASPEGTPLKSEAGIYAVHQKPASHDITDPRSLSFEAILEGIAVSQTIPTDPADYGMESGTMLYKGADGKLNSGVQEGTEEICIQAAAAENLSAGTAAWVNGCLILGTGANNKAYYEMGYTDGFHKVMDGVNISYVYHEHTGDADSGGGCYTKAVYSDGIGRFGWFLMSEDPDDPDHLNVACNSCRQYVSNFYASNMPPGMDMATYLSLGEHPGCPNAPKTLLRYDLNCGKTTSSIESAAITFN